jgi:hypothetical protein
MRKALTCCERVNAKAIARCGVAGARSAHRYIKALERRACRERVLSRLAAPDSLWQRPRQTKDLALKIAT